MSDLRTHPKIKIYLDTTSRKVRSKALRESIRDEIFSHIEESIERKVKEGLAVEEAVESALADLGSAESVSREFSVAHRPLYLKSPFILTVGFCVLLISALAITEQSRRMANHLDQQTRQIVEQHRVLFLEDQALLSKEPFFDFPGKERDAGPELNDRILWANGIRAPMLQSNIQKTFLISDKNTKLVERNNQWLDHADQIDWSSIDLSWMKDLGKYDHWDLYQSGPFREYGTGEQWRTITPWAVPVPNYSNLMDWQRLRLLKGISERRLLPALQEVRQFERLIYSHEVLVNEMVVVGMLNNERNAFEYGVAHHLIQETQWKPVSQELTTRAKRAMYGFSELFDIAIDPELMLKVFDGKTAKAGMCGAISERLSFTILRRMFTRHPIFFEPSYDDRFALMDQVLRNAQSHCRISGIAGGLRGWDDPDAGLGWFSGSPWERLKWRYLSRIPVMRRIALQEFDLFASDTMSGAYRSNPLPGDDKKK